MTNIFSIFLYYSAVHFFLPRTYNFAFSTCVFSVRVRHVRCSVCAGCRVLMAKQSHCYDVDLHGEAYVL